VSAVRRAEAKRSRVSSKAAEGVFTPSLLFFVFLSLSKVSGKMNTYAKYVRARFERGNLIVEVSKDAFKDAETRKEATKELQQIIKTYFGIRFFIRLSIVYAFTALFCACVALIIVLLK